jgi:dipeptidyl aminopeptidase/acylaminoacyl peptidase
VLYQTSSGNTESDFYVNGQLKRVPAGGGDSTQLASDFDEQLYNIRWTAEGIFFIAWNRTERKLYRLDPDRDAIKAVKTPVTNVWAFDFDADGKAFAFAGRNADMLTEVFKRPQRSRQFEQLTGMTKQVKSWTHGTSEVISWNSKDGALIGWAPWAGARAATFPLS